MVTGPLGDISPMSPRNLDPSFNTTTSTACSGRRAAGLSGSAAPAIRAHSTNADANTSAAGGWNRPNCPSVIMLE